MPEFHHLNTAPPPKSHFFGPSRKKRYRRKSGGQAARWAAIRRRIFEVRGEECADCGVGAEAAKIVIHHLWPVSEGGPEFPPPEVWNDPEKGLLPVCAPCHRLRHGSEDDRAYAAFLDAEWGLR